MSEYSELWIDGYVTGDLIAAIEAGANVRVVGYSSNILRSMLKITFIETKVEAGPTSYSCIHAADNEA